MAILQLGTSYADLQAAGINAMTLSSAELASGTDISIIGAPTTGIPSEKPIFASLIVSRKKK